MIAQADSAETVRVCEPTLAEKITKSLLGYGVVAGAVFEASVLIQGITRHGFRLAHDDASLLANGPLGWIQIVTFLLAALVAACFVLARYFSRAGRRGLAIYSRATAIAFLAAFLGETSGSTASATVVPFYLAVLAAFTWIAVTSVHLYRNA
jgi:hypothetical protein